MRIARIIFKFVVNFIKSGLNSRNILTLPLNFFINFSPIFIWLLIFKNAGLIPNEIRPDIHVSLIYNYDLLLFTPTWTNLLIWSLISVIFTFIWFQLVKIFANKFNLDSICSNLIKNNEYYLQLRSVPSSDDTCTTESDSDTDESCEEYNISSVIDTEKITRSYAIYVTPVLFFAIWPLLNLADYFKTPLTTHKDIFAWCFYVLAHLIFPILTAVYLYAFQPQGVVKYFSIALGVQNIAGVITHLLFPNAPPWFIHLYGPDADANYDMPGYAAGLTRVDLALGTHLNSNGFHKSPIVFGAFPSLHSAMATQVFLFIYYSSSSILLRAGALSFVVIQWWGTIYLDHHFKIDLFAGAMYALLSFAIFYPFVRRKEIDCINYRLSGNFNKSSSMGMRVFRNTRLERWFDPLA